MLVNIRKFIKDNVKIYAHIKEGESPETLEEHLKRTFAYYEEISNKKDIDCNVKNIIKEICSNDNITKDEENFIYEIFVNAIFLHDIGKINPRFQTDKMNNLKFESSNITSEHSLVSALIYIDVYMPEISKFKNKKLMTAFLYCFAYQISRHHSNLEDLEIDDFLLKLKKVQEEGYYLQYIYKDRLLSLDLLNSTFLDKDKTLSRFNIPEIEFYILNKLLYSIILTCDYYATYEYINSSKVEINNILDIDKFARKYRSTELYKTIDKYKNNQVVLKKDDINTLRSDIFIESEDGLINNLDSNIFYLEAPTGSGKTNTSINLAIKILENDKSIKNIFYIFPFNTLIEQTKEVIENVFEYEKDFIVVNSVTPITKKEELNYEETFLNYEFMHYPIILTSHVNLFEMLFGTTRKYNMLLSRIANSVLILDEIQVYKNKIWKKIINFLEKYSKYLNVKIIIMSATLPRLDKLLDSESQMVSLIKNRDRYFKNRLFQDRVKIDTGLLEKGKINLDDLVQYISNMDFNNKKVLIEFIKKTTARDFYNILKNKMNEIKIVEITGDDNKFFRKKVLEEINTSQSIIVISTQVIEAGVDIDMDIGFKDISLIDSEEQFLGRINRSCKKENCTAYFFDIDEQEAIYKGDLRNQYSIKDKKYLQILKTKDFDQYYKLVIDNLNNNASKYNYENIEKTYNNARKLFFNTVSKEMKLINQIVITLFLSSNIELDGNIISGEDIWKKYVKLCLNNNIKYEEKQIKLSKLKELLNLFTYDLIVYDNEKCNKYFNEEFGELLYIENGEEFMEDGKFNRKRYIEKCGEVFW